MNWEPGSSGRRLKCIENWGPADLIVAKKVLVELKSVEAITAAHKKQVQTYLALTGLKLGYLINFGESVLKNGITRCVNKLEEYPPPNLCASASLRE